MSLRYIYKEKSLNKMPILNLFSTKKVINTYFDFFFIKFPIWVPLIFILLTQHFSNHYFLIIIGFLILGEIHFGITYVFFTDKKYYSLFFEKSFIYFFIPISLILLLIFFSFIFSLKLILFYILLFNFFHVNRQSVGVLKLYRDHSKNLTSNFAIFFLYLLSFSLCFIATLKFIFQSNIYFEYEYNLQIFFLILFISSILLIFFLMLREKRINLSILSSYITGVLIFTPVLFFSKLIDVFAAGVGMHFVQYIALTSVIFIRKNNQINETHFSLKNLKFLTSKGLYLIIYLFFYSSLMVSFSQSNFIFKGEKFGIYLIPVLFQFLHFYFDIFIWKFSDPHSRANLLPVLYKK